MCTSLKDNRVYPVYTYFASIMAHYNKMYDIGGLCGILAHNSGLLYVVL